MTLKIINDIKYCYLLYLIIPATVFLIFVEKDTLDIIPLFFVYPILNIIMGYYVTTVVQLKYKKKIILKTFYITYISSFVIVFLSMLIYFKSLEVFFAIIYIIPLGFLSSIFYYLGYDLGIKLGEFKKPIEYDKYKFSKFDILVSVFYIFSFFISLYLSQAYFTDLSYELTKLIYSISIGITIFFPAILILKSNFLKESTSRNFLFIASNIVIFVILFLYSLTIPCVEFCFVPPAAFALFFGITYIFLTTLIFIVLSSIRYILEKLIILFRKSK